MFVIVKSQLSKGARRLFQAYDVHRL